MRIPYSISAKMLTLCTEIARLLGQSEGFYLAKPQPKLRRSNRIRTIQGSLAIEGNTFAIEQVTAILDGKKVLGPPREILEVQNAIRAYDQISTYNAHSAKSLKTAHAILMEGLLADAGKWRTQSVGVFQGEKIAHAAPQAKRVPELMDQLFSFLKTEKETHPLILSAIFHYELEFIDPFSDGNGRIGRLWQTTLLTHFHPIFEFTPVESVIHNRQQAYYKALGLADKAGNATPFIEFSLETISEALKELNSALRPAPLSVEDRLSIARERFQGRSFSRKDYRGIFKAISTATASRDLAHGVEKKILKKFGEKALTTYLFDG